MDEKIGGSMKKEETGRRAAPCTDYRARYRAAEKENTELRRQVSRLQEELNDARAAYDAINGAFFWRITGPLRRLVNAVGRTRIGRLAARGVRCVRNNGLSAALRKARQRLSAKKRGFRSEELRQYAKKCRREHRLDFCNVAFPAATPAQLERQQKTVFAQEIKFSILVPLYNTPKAFLRELIESVCAQTYENWELCLADGSGPKNAGVEAICRKYAQMDARIRYEKLDENCGISGNTNACIRMATGDYFGLLDHDDLLHPSALFEVMQAICERGAEFVYTDEITFRRSPSDADGHAFKPDYGPDTLRSYNYICHFSVFSGQLLQKAGGELRSAFDGSQDYDLILRLTEQTDKIVHIPKILYYWRRHKKSTASDVSTKPYTIEAGKKALAEHLARVGLSGRVCNSRFPSTYRIQYQLDSEPLVSILIPNKDHVDELKRCLRSVIEKTTYPNWEIIIIENNSCEEQTFAYYEQLREDERIRVVKMKIGFNYSAINNYGVGFASGRYLLLLNNDTEVITSDWIEQMLMFCQRKDVGAVGVMLYYPDDTVQHGGVIVGLGGVAAHSHRLYPRKSLGYMSRLSLAQNYSAVTGACMMLRREVWEEVGGLDESFAVAFNDVDLCLRLRRLGYLIVWTPYAQLYHLESKSRGLDDTPEKAKRMAGEQKRFRERWGAELDAGDPYYNPNLTLNRDDFSLRQPPLGTGDDA